MEADQPKQRWCITINADLTWLCRNEGDVQIKVEEMIKPTLKSSKSPQITSDKEKDIQLNT